ncbi:membrane protein [Mycolicibacterium madagascariense]|uniref:Membrane protein n=1 Tax=Mycolicibacterium madagascariense TaxID=212765 RepID=A0A7I7X9X2_9MYCO|nr:membrane protein [Mycolicibacterium madagascariense]
MPSVLGVALAGTGAAHFVRPDLFEGVTKAAFPKDTARYLKINGGLETAIGLGLAVPKTRKLAVIGLLGYGAYLAVNVVRNQ